MKEFFLKIYLFHVHYIMPNILIQVNETTSSPSWWSDWKQRISYIFLTRSSILHPHGGLIHLKTNPRDKIECSRFARKVM
jgi:hypothetical protein